MLKAFAMTIIVRGDCIELNIFMSGGVFMGLLVFSRALCNLLLSFSQPPNTEVKRHNPTPPLTSQHQVLAMPRHQLSIRCR